MISAGRIPGRYHALDPRKRETIRTFVSAPTHRFSRVSKVAILARADRQPVRPMHVRQDGAPFGSAANRWSSLRNSPSRQDRTAKGETHPPKWFGRRPPACPARWPARAGDSRESHLQPLRIPPRRGMRRASEPVEQALALTTGPDEILPPRRTTSQLRPATFGAPLAP